jgi:anti-anti-sigma regulatory factor
MSELSLVEAENVLIVQFKTHDLRADALTHQIGQEFLDLPAKSDGKILVDFKSVSVMSSAMIGKLLALHKFR